MISRAGRVLCTLVLTAGVGLSEAPHSLEIKLPAGVRSESVFIRYALTGDKLGGWVEPRTGVSSYFIDTHTATRIRALIDVPGCAIQTLDLQLSTARESYLFTCEPVNSVSLAGRLDRTDRLYGKQIEVQAKYVARWAQSLLGLGEDVIPIIPLGDVAQVKEDGRFHLSVPDLSSHPDLSGEIQIWARIKVSGETAALLSPSGPQTMKTRMGGLKVQSEYPAEIVFVPCTVNPTQFHDREGFALRPGLNDACDP